MKTKKDIPKEKSHDATLCTDKHCPFHSHLKLRGRTFEGIIVKKDPNRTAVIEWPRQFYITKYERYETRKTRLKVHNPPCINAQIGSKVKVMECRPISKTKNFVIISKNESN